MIRRAASTNSPTGRTRRSASLSAIQIAIATISNETSSNIALKRNWRVRARASVSLGIAGGALGIFGQFQEPRVDGARSVNIDLGPGIEPDDRLDPVAAFFLGDRLSGLQLLQGGSGETILRAAGRKG